MRTASRGSLPLRILAALAIPGDTNSGHTTPNSRSGLPLPCAPLGAASSAFSFPATVGETPGAG
jgi:hypothetical protein